MKFIDTVQIKISSGKGGAGCVSFRREALVPRGGPDGGDGGRGGDVIFLVNSQLSSLVSLSYQKKFQAQNGSPGGRSKSTGKNGLDLIIEVPKGTVVRGSTGEMLVDLGVEREFIILKGGRGGKGNFFYKSSVHQAPEIAQKGESGTSIDICLELKSIADVGIIGLPNAGKSTLISRISAARPKIADYPFTTLVPNLGVVRVGEAESYIVADIPGLIPGAHKGTGLGIQFLRHIERTKVFIHLIDPLPLDGELPWESYNKIIKELLSYDELKIDELDFEPLTKRPQLIVFNKSDLASSESLKQLCDDFYKEVKIKPFVVSAVSGDNIEPLVFKVYELLKGLGEDE